MNRLRAILKYDIRNKNTSFNGCYERSDAMGCIIGILMLVLGILGIKYGVSAIIIGLTFIGIALGIKKD